MRIYRVLLVSICIGFGLNVVQASSLREQFVALESAAKFQEQTLYTFIQHKELLEWAKRMCSSDAVMKGERFGVKLREIIDVRYTQMSDAEMLLDSLDLWNRVHAMHARLSPSISDDELCIRKILMYELQKVFRDWHIDLIDEKGLIDDFNTPNPPLREVQLKKEILDVLIDQSDITNAPQITVRVDNPEFLDTLSRDERLLAERSRIVMEHALREVLAMFLQKGRFSRQDIDTVADKIVLEYTLSCTSVAGKYEVTYEVDRNGVRKNTKTNALRLTVSTCTKVWFVLQKYWLSKLIVIHELGHHVWRYIDPNTELFTQLCRNSDGTPNGRCTRRDFVSDYAYDAQSVPQISQPAEDYAEHFQQWVIKRRDRPWFIDVKLRYFDKLFDRLK
jgi:hypothetical protein